MPETQRLRPHWCEISSSPRLSEFLSLRSSPYAQRRSVGGMGMAPGNGWAAIWPGIWSDSKTTINHVFGVAATTGGPCHVVPTNWPLGEGKKSLLKLRSTTRPTKHRAVRRLAYSGDVLPFLDLTVPQNRKITMFAPRCSDRRCVGKSADGAAKSTGESREATRSNRSRYELLTTRTGGSEGGGGGGLGSKSRCYRTLCNGTAVIAHRTSMYASFRLPKTGGLKSRCSFHSRRCR
ncbi:hypothetical protein M440DRAFT_1194014 [Trichoderma longibrachiatum ATCC 18648]|uniref:Uncharacterized protein n=1 Tax=Trichoderma longibrachiatum ATCC 18648 TaxID=983965 RepID=A0A2T4CAA7_TRILO|nr:hypothetical protein M440DRAFT_1194014 [Trichoderma longibrachiatum ATCC 18648]